MTPKLKDKYLSLHKQHGPIKIKCSSGDALPIDAIMDFQGGLKKGTVKNKLKLATRIFELGFIAPFFVWKHEGDYYNLDGHRRSEVLCEIREAGIEIPGMFPVAYIQAGSVEEAKEALLSISSQYGVWDQEELDNWLNDLDDEIRDSFRFLDREIDISLPIETEGGDDVQYDVKPVTKPGDLWELGGHRVLCGDSTDAEQIERLMSGDKADMVFTSPPYNANETLEYNDGKTRFMYKNKKDNLDSNKYIAFILNVFNNIKNKIRNDCNVLLNINYNANSESEYIKIINSLLENYNLRETIIWKKTGMPSRGYHLTRIYEFVFLLTIHKKKYFQNKEKHQRYFNFWEISNLNAQQENHRACFPVGLPLHGMKCFCMKDGIVLDPFLGSGSTLIACEKTGRICYGIEIDPNYCDVIVLRYKEWCTKNERKPIIKLNGTTYQKRRNGTAILARKAKSGKGKP